MAACDNLYVKGLPEEFDTDAVNQFFGACGTVVQAKSLGNGAALVRFSSVEEATMVKDAMNGQQPMGCNQPITIDYSIGGGKGKGIVIDPSLKGGGKSFVPQTSKGLFTPGDWECTACGDMQFARNAECRKCGCPKEGWGAAGGFGKAGKGVGVLNSPYGKGAKGKGGFKKSKLCSNYEEGWCPRGEACTFAHGEAELGTFQAGQGPVAVVNPVAWGGAGRDASSIRGLVDGLIKEGLPGANFSHDSNALYVSNLPYDTTDADLYVIFGAFGAIPPRGMKIMPVQPGARSYAFVTFIESANAEFALMAMNGVTQPDGAQLIVRKKVKKGESTGALPNPGSNTSELCGDFQRGDCSRGDRCRYSHGDGGGVAAAAPAAAGGVTPVMLGRLQAIIATGKVSSYDVSQQYIMEHLGHVTNEVEMQTLCGQLLLACSQMGLA